MAVEGGRGSGKNRWKVKKRRGRKRNEWTAAKRRAGQNAIRRDRR